MTNPADLVTKLAAGEDEAREALETLVAEAVAAARGEVPQPARVGAVVNARRALGMTGRPESRAMRRAFRALMREPVELPTGG